MNDSSVSALTERFLKQGFCKHCNGWDSHFLRFLPRGRWRAANQVSSLSFELGDRNLVTLHIAPTQHVLYQAQSKG